MSIKTEKRLSLLKSYLRPIRGVIFTLLLVAIVISWLAGAPIIENSIVEIVVIGCFADLGIYSVARSKEKIEENKNNKP
jgi:hypothetical protein|tara:strand:+ start:804 stop:1040 length:237 start_codon:yes stop_codon:yes gene_type:complete